MNEAVAVAADSIAALVDAAQSSESSTTVPSQSSSAIAASLVWSEVLLVLIMALISALTVVGNLVVLLSFALDRQIRQPSNYFIFSLAISDLVGFFGAHHQ
jgi:muscarinic acetylcholine receptor M3